MPMAIQPTTYAETNRNLLAVLRQGLDKEQQEIRDIAARIKPLREQVHHDHTAARQTSTRKEEVLHESAAAVQQLHALEEKLHSKKVLQQTAVESIQLLREQEHAEKKDWEKKVQQLKQSIFRYLQLKKEESKKLQAEVRELSQNLAQIRRRREQIIDASQQAQESMRHFRTSRSTDFTDRFFSFELQAAQKERKERAEELAALKAALQEEQQTAAQSIAEVRAKVAKQEEKRQHIETELAAARQELVRESLLREKKKQTEHEIEEQALRLKKLRQALHRFFSQEHNIIDHARDEKSSIKVLQYRSKQQKHKLKTLVREVRRAYAEQRSRLDAAQQQLQSQLESILHRQQDVESRMLALHRQEQELQQQLQEQDARFAAENSNYLGRMKTLISEISRVKEFQHRDAARLHKLSALLHNIKALGLEDPFIVRRMKKESTTVKHHLSAQAQELTQKQEELGTLKGRYPQLRHEYEVRKKQLQARIIQRQRQAEVQARTLRQIQAAVDSFTRKRQILDTHSQVIKQEYVQDTRQQHHAVERVLQSIQDVLSQKQSHYQQDLEQKRIMLSKLRHLKQEYVAVQHKLNKGRTLAEEQSKALTRAEQKKAVVGMEEKQVADLLESIQEMHALLSKARHKMAEHKALAGVQEQKVQETLHQHLDALQRDLEQKAQGLLQELDAKIGRLRREKKQTHEHLRENKDFVSRKIQEYEKEFRRRQHDSTTKMERLHREESALSLRLQEAERACADLTEKVNAAHSRVGHWQQERQKLQAKALQWREHVAALQLALKQKQKKDDEIQKLKSEVREVHRIMNGRWLRRQHLLRGKKQPPEEHHHVHAHHVRQPVNREQMREFLGVVDTLLGDLPKQEIARFAKSPDCKMYKRILAKYNVKAS